MVTVDSALKGKVARWRVRWVDETGTEHSKVFQRKPDAQDFLNGFTADVHRGDYVSPRKGNELFRDVAEQWFTTKAHRKPSTVAGYRSILDNLVLPKWGDVPIKAIDYSAYSAWLGGLSVDGSVKGKPLSASRITQTHQLAGAVLKYAIRTGKLTKNVAAEIDRGQDLPEAIEAEHVYLTHAQLLSLAGAAGRFDVLTLVLGYCGLRFGEAAALRRRHVKNRQITVRASATTVTGQGIVETDSTKTKRQRQVPVPEPVWKRLEQILPDKGDDLVFPSHKGGHLPLGEYRWAFDRAVDTVAEATNAARQRESKDGKKPVTPEFPALTPHALRHSCASLAISAGANVKVVQRLLGHASATMTLDRYGHLMDDDLTGVAEALSKAIESTAVSLRYSIDQTKAATGQK